MKYYIASIVAVTTFVGYSMFFDEPSVATGNGVSISNQSTTQKATQKIQTFQENTVPVKVETSQSQAHTTTSIVTSVPTKAKLSVPRSIRGEEDND